MYVDGNGFDYVLIVRFLLICKQFIVLYYIVKCKVGINLGDQFLDLLGCYWSNVGLEFKKV